MRGIDKGNAFISCFEVDLIQGNSAKRCHEYGSLSMRINNQAHCRFVGQERLCCLSHSQGQRATSPDLFLSALGMEDAVRTALYDSMFIEMIGLRFAAVDVLIDQILQTIDSHVRTMMTNLPSYFIGSRKACHDRLSVPSHH